MSKSSIRVELNNAGFNELRQSPGVQGSVMAAAQAIADDANGSAPGADFQVGTLRTTGRRARVNVYANNREAQQAEVDQAVLTSAAGRHRR